MHRRIGAFDGIPLPLARPLYWHLSPFSDLRKERRLRLLRALGGIERYFRQGPPYWFFPDHLSIDHYWWTGSGFGSLPPVLPPWVLNFLPILSSLDSATATRR